MTPWDVFISHASDDKEAFVDPLARRLRQLAVRVWYDKFVLIPGDRLSEKIAEGLAKSRYGLLVISPAFISKKWTRYELSGLINRFVEDNARLIPLWLGITRAEVVAFNPALADLLSIRANKDNVEACMLEVLRIVRPQLYENVSLLGGKLPVKIKKVRRKELKEGPIRHHDLPAALLVRIQNIWFSTRDVVSVPLEKTIENFQRDLHLESEVEVWERIVSAANAAMERLKTNDSATRQQLFKVLFPLAEGNSQSVMDRLRSGDIDTAIVEAAVHGLNKAVPAVTVSDVDV
jgi:hypothetical protein